MHRRGEPAPPHPRHCPLPDAQPALRALLPQGLRSPARNTHAREAIRGWEAEGPQGSPGEPQPPPGRTRSARRPPRLSHGGFCSRDPSSPFLGKRPRGRADARDAQASGWLWVSDPSHLSQLTQKGDAEMLKVCLRKALRDPGQGGRRGQRTRGRRGFGQGRERGARKEGETGRRRQREAGGPRLPTRVPGPERKPRARISDPGPGDAAFWAFPPRAPFPFPHLDASRLPQPPLARYGLSRGPALAWTLPLLAREPGCPVAQPTPLLRGLERASPGQGWAEGGMRRAPASGGGGQRGPRDRPQTCPY